MDEAQRREKERAEREREKDLAERERILQEDYKRNSSVWCLLCFACTIRNQADFRERWERQWPVRGERERMPGQTLIFLFQRSKRMIFLLSLLFLILFCQRERRDKEISKGKSAVRHSVNALSWAPCFHKNLVLSIYLSCRIEGNINSGLFMMDSLCLLITSHNYGTHFSFNFLN